MRIGRNLDTSQVKRLAGMPERGGNYYLQSNQSVRASFRFNILFMKIFSVVTALLSLGLLTLPAQTKTQVDSSVPVPTDRRVIDRGANHRVWQWETFEKQSDGTIISQPHQVTELASGLNYQDATGQWVESKEIIEPFPQGAVARQGQHQVIFANNLNSYGSIDMQTSDGKRLRSNVLGLMYVDTSTDDAVMIARLQDSTGQLIATNRVLYTNAFEGVKADMRYTYRKDGFEQDVILREQPPTPETYGFNPDTTVLEVVTEFINPPDATVTESPGIGEDQTDDEVNWGTTSLGRGKAFNLGGQDSSATVFKRYLNIQGRHFLLERVRVEDIQASLSKLPEQAANDVKLPAMVAKNMILPEPPPVQTKGKPMNLALATPSDKGFVLDYVTLNSNQTNYTFKGDTTYYISGRFSVTGTNIIEGGTVIKFGSFYGGISTGNAGDCIISKAGPYRMAILTSKDDNSVGEIVSGSTGVPTNYPSAIYLTLYLGPGSGVTNDVLSYLRFSYAGTAISQSWSSSYVTITPSPISNCQFINCTTAISDDPYYYSTITQNLFNCLFSRCVTGVDNVRANYSGYVTVCGVNVTVDQVNTMLTMNSNDHSTRLVLTNSILTGVQHKIWLVDTGSDALYSTTTNACFIASTNTGIYQSMGAGNYYLATNSPYRDVGLTNIGSAFLSSIAAKTTYPPVVYSNTVFNSILNFSLQASRDTNAPDLGYHYDPFDYLLIGARANSYISASPGIALGWYETSSTGYGLYIANNTILALNGCTLARFNSVQENSGGWTNRGINAITGDTGSSGYIFLWASFCRFMQPAGPSQKYFGRPMNAPNNNQMQLATTSCEFYNGQIADSYEQLCLTNCLFNRANLNEVGSMAAYNYPAIKIRGGTFIGGQLTATILSSTSPYPITIMDCAFDGTSVSAPDYSGGNTNLMYCNFNAYLTNQTRFPVPSGGSQDITNLISYYWQTGAIGNYYLTNGSPLVDSGNVTNSASIGMYHYTTQTNQMKEGNSRLDIGYHYVAVDGSGNPIDSNGNGTPDYLEDANGNGIVDNGESPWSWGILVQPQSVVQAQGQNATFSVSMGGTGTFTYQWRSNGVAISGANSSSYTKWVIRTNDQANYSVVVSNGISYLTSSNAFLGVVTPLYLVSGSTNAVALQGTTTNFGVTVGGTYLSYQWAKNGANLANGGRISGATSNILTLSSLVGSDAGNYSVQATNLFGSVSSSASLTVITNPFITVPPTSTNIVQSEDFTLSVTAGGNGLSYQWWLTNNLVTNAIPGATASTYNKLVAQTNDAGHYSVVITNLAGYTNANADVTVLVPPWITQQPASALVSEGSPVTFTTTAIGTTNLSYQWFKNGTDAIPGATNTSLTLNAVGSTDAAGYSVLVTNVVGTNVSAWAWLSVSLTGGGVANGWGAGPYPPTNPPAVTMFSPTNTNPASPAVYLYGPPISIRALASSQYSYVTNVAFFAGTNLNTCTNFLGWAVPGANTKFALAWTNSAPGTNLLKACAYDCNGNSSTSAVVYVIMDIPPAIVADPGRTLVWDGNNIDLLFTNIVSDEGLPYGVTNISWSLPGGVAAIHTYSSISSNITINTLATFTNYGIYSPFQLTASDGFAGSSAGFGVTIKQRPQVYFNSPTNNTVLMPGTPFVLNATAISALGSIAGVTFYNGANLIGNGVQSLNNTYTYLWPSAPVGTNLVLAVATDQDGLTATAQVAVVVSPVKVNPGSNQVLILSGLSVATTMNGNVSGGLPGATAQWSQVSGPAMATFSNPYSLGTSVGFTNVVGNYLFRLTASDGYSSDSNVMTIVVISNRPPIVDAGPNRIVAPGATIYLNGSVTDDGLPSVNSLRQWWSLVSWPATAANTITFANSNAPVTTAGSLTVPGVYTVRLMATDGPTTNSADMTVTVAAAGSRTYTIDADFAEGNLVNVNFTDIPNQLQLNQKVSPFPFVWVACTERSTIVRIDANTGQILGEYRTAPELINATTNEDETITYSTNSTYASPSRTTVDRYGNAWVCNRNDNLWNTNGSITRVGLVIGGTRGIKYPPDAITNYTFTPDPNGQWIKPPFKYCTAVDRDGDGLIRTSGGLGNVLPWHVSGTLGYSPYSPQYVDLHEAVPPAEDECIINYTRVAGTGARTIAIDANNDLWVGGHDNSLFEKIDGVTGLPVANTIFTGQSAYGGLIDGRGTLWSSAYSGNFFRFDVNRRFDMSTNPPVVIATYNGDLMPAACYGISIDPRTGFIWYNNRDAWTVGRINPNNYSTNEFKAHTNLKGLAVDDSGNVWVGNDNTSQIEHYRTDGTFVGLVDLGCDNNGPYGISIDSNGKVWVACNSGTAVRIDPNLGPRMLNDAPNSSGYLLGAAELVVNVDGGQPPSSPYNYSDMTGYVSLGATKPSGVWRVVHDSGIASNLWGTIQWSNSIPAGTAIKVEVRAADTVLGLNDTNFIAVANNVPFSGGGVAGRYAEVRVTLSHDQGINATPILYDLTIAPAGVPAIAANTANFCNSDKATLFENTVSNVLKVLANDLPPTGTNLIITAVSPAGYGVVTIGSGSTNLIYTPNTNFFGLDQFSYTVTDGRGGFGRAAVTVVVGEVPPTPDTNSALPLAIDIPFNFYENENEREINFGYDSTREFIKNAINGGTNLVIKSVTQPAHGFVRFSGCHICYTPAPEYYGSDRFQYTIRNDAGFTATAWINVNVIRAIPIHCGDSLSGVLSSNSPDVFVDNNGKLARLYCVSQGYLETNVFDLDSAATNAGVGLKLNSPGYYQSSSVDYSWDQFPATNSFANQTNYYLKVVLTPSEDVTQDYVLSMACQEPAFPQMGVWWGTNYLPSGSGLDYGVATVGTSWPVNLTITNSGTAPLTISNVPNWLSDSNFLVTDTSLTNDYITINSGSSSNLIVWFAPSQAGQFSTELQLFGNDPTFFSYDASFITTNPYILHFSGQAAPSNSVPPTVSINGPITGTVFEYTNMDSCGGTAVPVAVSVSTPPGVGRAGVILSVTPVGGNFAYTNIFLSWDGAAYYTNIWSGMPPGSYSLTARGFDQNGLQAGSAPVLIRVLSAISVLFGGTNLPNGSSVDFGLVPAGVTAQINLVLTNNTGHNELVRVTDYGQYYIWNSEAHPYFNADIPGHQTTNVVWSYPYDLSVTGGTADHGTFAVDFGDVSGGCYSTLKMETYVTLTNSGSPPSITLIAPANNSTFQTNTTISMAVSTTAASGQTISRVDYYAVTNGVKFPLHSESSAPFGYDWVATEPGQYLISAVVVDSAGVAAVSANALNIRVVNYASNSPSILVYQAQTNLCPNYSTLDFGITNVGATVSQFLTISNLGGQPLNISSIFLSDTNQFSLVNVPGLPCTVATNSSTNLTLVYYAGSVGAASSFLTIFHNDPLNQPFYLTNIAYANPVSGVTPPTVSLTAPSDGLQVAYPSSVTVSAIARSATNSSLAGVSFVATSSGQSFQIGQVLAQPGQTGMVATLIWSRPTSGTYAIKAVATDRSGMAASSTNIVRVTILDVQVNPTNLPPVANDDHLWITGGAANLPTYPIYVLRNDIDPNGDPLTLTGFDYTGHLGRLEQDGDHLLFTPYPSIEGTNWASYTVSDGRGGSATAWVQIVVKMVPLPQVILVSPLDGQYFDLPTERTNRYLNLFGYAYTTTPGLSIASVSFYDEDQLLGYGSLTNISGTNLYYYKWNTPAAGWHRIAARVTDSVGQENLSSAYVDGQQLTTAGAMIYILGNTNNTPPVAVITNLAATITNINGFDTWVYPIVTNGMIDVLGLARDVNSGDSLSYQILLQKTDGTVIANLTPSPDATGFHPSGDVNGVLGTNLDLSLYENGTYDIVLTVFDGWEESTDSARILLNTQLKIGNFSFSVQDAVIPVRGVPLTVTRTYNSFNLDKGDFGYSWTYAVSDVNLQLDEERQDTVELDSSERFSLRVGGGRDVTLTLPDGRRTTFQFYFGAATTCTGDPQDPSWCYPALWQAPPGVNYTLTTLSHGGQIMTNYYNSLTGYWNNEQGTGFENYDFAGYALIAQDGTRYIIPRVDEDEHFFDSGYDDNYFAHTYGAASLTRIIEPDGNSIGINSSSINHYDPEGTLTRAINFTRDDQNRIIAISDPNSSSNGLPIMQYLYDTNGNLSKTFKLTDRAANGGAGAYDVTTYQYTNTHFLHFITGILDPRGVQVARTYYDDSGRIIQVVDANGKSTRFLHDTTNHTEVVIDRSGRTNSYVYDLRGNVIIETNALNQPTFNTYDASNHLTSVTDALGNKTSYVYDDAGNQTQMTDANTNTTYFEYDGNGRLTKQTDPLGNWTQNLYDKETGNLTNTVQHDDNGAVVGRSSSIYDGDKLLQTLDARGQTNSTFGYDGDNLYMTADANGFVRTFAYDANGNQTGTSYVWTNADNQPVTVTTATIYDAAGRVTMTIDADGNTNQTFYNSLGKVDHTIDKFGNTASFVYDARGNAIQNNLADGTFTRTAYDDDGRPFLTQDRNQITGTWMQYDALGRATNTIRVTGVVINLVGDPLNAGQQTTTVGSYGTGYSTNSTVYMINGWVQARTGSDGQTTSYTYYPDGQVKAVTDPLSHTTTYAYDAAGRRTNTVDALTRIMQVRYDAVGRAVTNIFANNSFTVSGFNDLGQLTNEMDQAGLATQFGYDISGQLTNVIKPQVIDPSNGNPVGPQWAYTYDFFGRQVMTTDPLGRTNNVTYDALGRQLTMRLPMGQLATNVYASTTTTNHLKGQLWRQYDYKGQWTQYQYDRYGRVAAKYLFAVGASAPSNSVVYTYNTLGQLVQTVEYFGTNSSQGLVLALGPDHSSPGAKMMACLNRNPNATGGMAVLALLGLAFVAVPRTKRRELKNLALAIWDEQMEAFHALFGGMFARSFGRRRLRLPSYGWRFATLITLAALIANEPGMDSLWTARADYSYPGNNSTPTTRITTFAYDNDGHLAQVNCPEGVINYTYDAATGRHTGTNTRFSAVQYAYDELGRLWKVTVAKRNGQVLNTPETTTYGYDWVGNWTSVSLPNGVTSTYAYDNLNRLTNLVHKAGSTTNAIYSYKLDQTGRRTNGVEVLLVENTTSYQTNTLNWRYDGLYRLTNELSVSTSASGTYAYTNAFVYDLNGNRLSQTRTGGGADTITYGYDANDQLTNEVSSANGTTRYAYDANGSQTGRTNGTTINTYAYNVANKLTGVSLNGTLQASYLYNDSGIRVQTVSGTTNKYLIDANNHTGYAQVLEEMDANNALTRSYVIGDEVLAQCGTTATAPQYFLADGHGNNRQVSSISGTVSSHYNYDAYGNTQTTSTATPETTKLYCGEQYDSTLGMYNLRARYYNPSNGRFNQRDTFRGSIDDPQSLHKYLYCGADPVNGIDPSGNLTLTELAVVSGIVGVVSGLFAGAIAKVTGGSFWEAFFKGFISGSLTVVLVLLGVPPPYASAIASGTAASIIEAWNWWKHPQQFTPWKAAIRIGASIIIGFLGGWWFGKNLPDLGTQAEEIANVFMSGAVRQNIGFLATEFGKMSTKGVSMGTVSTLSNLTIKLIFAIYDKGKELIEDWNRRIENAGQ
jgi:RHS repeat-associated protein